MSAYPHRTNLLFGLPMTGRPIPPDVMFAFHSMVFPMNYNHLVLQLRGLEVGEARNRCAEYAIENNCKYLFFWDEDVACPPQSIPELVYKMEHHPNLGAVGGIYCLKRDPAEPLVFRGNGNGPFWDWRAGEFFEVSGIGMGCTLIRVDVFKDLKKPWFKTSYDYDKVMDATGSLETWTEDLWFCQRLTDTGKWKVYADASLLCTHYDMTTCKGYMLPPDSHPVQHLHSNGKSKILDLGSGESHYQTPDGTVITADPDEKAKPDYRCDLRKLPFGNKEFDVVFSPALEKYEANETEEVLTEWLRVMKDDGEIRLVVSDARWIAREVAEGRADPISLYHGQRKTGFTLESLKTLLEKHQLEVEKVKSDSAHIALRGKKSDGDLLR